MVKVEVEGQPLELDDSEVANSTVLTDLISLYGNSVPIQIGVPLTNWLDYVSTLNSLKAVESKTAESRATESKTLAASKCHFRLQTEIARSYQRAIAVMDYLDNKEQLGRWYKMVNSQYKISPSQVKVCLKDTCFLLADIGVEPILLTTDIDKFVADVKNVGRMSNVYIKNIITTLFGGDNVYGSRDNQTYEVYLTLANLGKNCFHVNNHQTASLGFIVINTKSRVFDDVYLERFVDPNASGNISLSGTSCLMKISPRIAAYYKAKELLRPQQEQHHYYYIDNGDKEDCLCTSKEPNLYLKEIKRNKLSSMYCFIRGVDNVVINNVIDEADVADGSGYVPLAAHDTGIKIRDFQIQSYNLSTLYARDYYIFLVCEVDPFAKALYAFSL